jgi:MraZ protein
VPRYIGEYDCKTDSKGRVVIPAGLKKQIPKESGGEMIINRGFDKCLTLFTKQDWEKETEKLDGLNAFNSKDRQFMRLFNSGATEISIDNASRILIPKKLMEYAEIESDVVFYAWGNKIEIWSKKHHDEHMKIDADAFSALAEEVMSRKKTDNDQA